MKRRGFLQGVGGLMATLFSLKINADWKKELTQKPWRAVGGGTCSIANLISARPQIGYEYLTDPDSWYIKPPSEQPRYALDGGRAALI
ncbi:MAG: hypothetical protein U1E51_07685 [Candidatus Binatia bacterium]|nr:hypothetical protein [Candidatus Binatia bacterium]